MIDGLPSLTDFAAVVHYDKEQNLWVCYLAALSITQTGLSPYSAMRNAYMDATKKILSLTSNQGINRQAMTWKNTLAVRSAIHRMLREINPYVRQVRKKRLIRPIR